MTGKVQVTEKGGHKRRRIIQYMFTEVGSPLISSAKRYSATSRIRKLHKLAI